jgi:FtsP/CotA-like multicopper oxidase with cupredoxin domain
MSGRVHLNGAERASPLRTPPFHNGETITARRHNIMRLTKLMLLAGVATAGLLAYGPGAKAETLVQCPKAPGAVTTNADSPAGTATVVGTPTSPDGSPIKCKSLTAGDGFITLADGAVTYTFGFSERTGVTALNIAVAGRYDANFTAPTIDMDEGDDFYLTLTNVGFANRPDLFDPHTVHFHGFPNAMPVFDGEPEGSFGTNISNSFTFYYHPVQPGTYMYHCHQEAAEHMQMGMLGNLYVRPKQNKLADGTKFPNGFIHHTNYHYVYNDGDGSTYYDVEVPLQIDGFDPTFHKADQGIQPPPFAIMKDAYPMFNGRGYPQTVVAGPLPDTTNPVDGTPHTSQRVPATVTATQNQKVLLRISSLDVQRFYTISLPGIPMRVVGRGARIFRGNGEPLGTEMSYVTDSVSLGGGESYDVILDTANVAKGTYFLATTNLNYLVNGASDDYGGLMTEVVIQ